MGRIEDAIRKAQASQQRNTGRSTRQGSSRWQDPAQHASKSSQRSAVPEIHASHIVDIDNEWLQEHRVIAATEQDERVGPYRQLRTRLLKTMRDNQWSTLAITSAHEGAGNAACQMRAGPNCSPGQRQDAAPEENGEYDRGYVSHVVDCGFALLVNGL